MAGESGTAQKLVFVMGSGVVRNAWAPVIAAVKRVYPRVDSPVLANTAMANLVFHLRWAQFDHTRRSSPDAATAKALDTVKAHREEVCLSIAKELTWAESHGELSVQDGFEFVWNRYIGPIPSFYLVTTNWDRVVDQRMEQQFPTLKDRVLHVHGDHRDPSTLLLPSELAFESYYSDQTRSVALRRHRAIMDAIDQADLLVIYGLSLSPLDAELHQLISTGIDESNAPKTVEIVDLDPEAVAKQLRVIVRSTHLTVRCWTPSRSIPAPP